MNEAPSNLWPVNQAALMWLKEAKEPQDQQVSYLAQLAMWGLDKGLVEVPPPMSASQPERHNLENAVGTLLTSGSRGAEFATRWFLSNPNLDQDQQDANLTSLLDQASTPQEAAQIVVETAYDLMVAESATSPD